MADDGRCGDVFGPLLFKTFYAGKESACREHCRERGGRRRT